MADAVQRRLEAMVPELQYCLKRRLLSRAEVSALVRQRRALEYRLHRRTVTKLDYLRYIRSELLVEELLRVREGAGMGGKPGKARYGALRRVVRLLWAMIERWGYQAATARTALQVAAAVPNRRLLARLYGRLLQLHVHDVQLWSEAALYEFTANGNVRAARSLFQRALRHNSASVELWAAYHRLETQHWQLVHSARMTDAPLKLDSNGAIRAYEKLTARLAKGAQEEGDEEAEEEVSFLELAVPRRVATEALKQCPLPSMVRALLQVYADFTPHSLGAAMRLLHTATRLGRAYASVEWLTVIAEAPLILALAAPQEPLRGLHLCAQAFEAMAVSGELLAAQLRVYRTLGEAHTASTGGIPLALYQKLFMQCASLQQQAPEALLVEWLAFLRALPSPADLPAMARTLCAAKPRSPAVWCAVLQLAVATTLTPELIGQLLFTGLAASEPSAALAALAIDVFASSLVSPPASSRVLTLLQPHLAVPRISPALTRALLGFFSLHYGLAETRQLVSMLLQRSQAADTVLACVALEDTETPEAAARAVGLLQQALRHAEGNDAAQLWAALVRLQHGTQAAAAQNSAFQARRKLRGAALASFERLLAGVPVAQVHSCAH